MRLSHFVAFIGLCGCVWGLFEQCNHLIYLKANEKIYINSPFYPNSYPLGTSCRYTVLAAAAEQRLSFKCRIRLNVPSGATRCQQEAFYFNRDGSELLTNSEYFCGTGEMERKSFLNRAVISYVSTLRTATKTATSTAKVNKLKTHEVLASLKSEATTTTTTTSTISEAPLVLPPTPLATTTTTTTPFNLSSDETDALDYIVTLLNETENPMLTGLMNISDDIISKLLWRDEYDGGMEPRIVSNNVIDGVDGFGGGRFSCLVEVITTARDCECGWSNTDLKVAGVSMEASVNEFPPMAGILTKQMGRIFCGGTIINQRYVLSAAHCFTTPTTNQAVLLRIVAGEHDTNTSLESYYTRYYDVERLVVHADFRSTLMTLRNDVALLRTTESIEWNRGVGPACLPWRYANGSYVGQPSARRHRPPRAGQRLDTAGWGTISFGGPQATRLLKTSLDVIGTERCRQQLHVVPTHTFCTYTPGSDTCQYDSGGGLYARYDSRLYAVGVVSYGYACAAAQPSVNVRIAGYLKWIKRHTADVAYCKK